MRNYILSLLFFTIPFYSCLAQTTTPRTIYLFPGQGANCKLFNNIDFPTDIDTIHMTLPTPNRGETMNTYAQRFISQIDTTKPFVLMGVSLGGMICTELSTMLNEDTTIIISSAKCWKELPNNYTFQRSIPINKMVTKTITKGGAILLQPIVEPDSRTDRSFFYNMLMEKDPTYLKRTINMIINWEREEAPKGIFHIHGTADNTIPYKNVECNYTIKNGSHMMTYTMGKEISLIINQTLSPK